MTAFHWSRVTEEKRLAEVGCRWAPMDCDERGPVIDDELNEIDLLFLDAGEARWCE